VHVDPKRNMVPDGAQMQVALEGLEPRLEFDLEIPER
jgi:hypothetical protein